ncbi:hypothetical protein LY76DRAFT_598991 [Colletotrichum caudatum]|nr:hypothetical protein LY76DRAFT_598991 [Colletotrichum caudatum]
MPGSQTPAKAGSWAERISRPTALPPSPVPIAFAMDDQPGLLLRPRALISCLLFFVLYSSFLRGTCSVFELPSQGNAASYLWSRSISLCKLCQTLPFAP